MTALFEAQLDKQPNRRETLGNIRRIVNYEVNYFGARKLAAELIGVKGLERVPDSLPLSSTADNISNHYIAICLRQPTSEITDKLLKFVQNKSETEIYEGAREDLEKITL